MFAADLEHISLPKVRKLGGARAGSNAQCRMVLDHDGERRYEGEHHRAPATLAVGTAASSAGLALRSPRRLEPINFPAAGSGAMMTCTLSESLSASVFWIRSG